MSIETRDIDRYALITYLADKLGGNGRLGKKALQKYVYLIQELENVPVGYKYDFYTYGPYSRDLSGDLDIVDSLCGVDINYDKALNAYSIISGDLCSDFFDRGEGYLKRYGSEINLIIEKFNNRLAKELELIATIVYITKDKTELRVHDKEELIKMVADIKPKYRHAEIISAVEELKQEGYLKLNFS